MQIRFANPKDGWVFSPRLFSTHDGGATWTDENPAGDILSLEPVGDTVWAMQKRKCPNSQPVECSFTLLTSDGNDRKLRPAPVQPPMHAFSNQLVRTGLGDAFIFSTYFATPGTPALTGDLTVTHDGGKSWQQVATDLPKQLGEQCNFASGSGKLWLLCAEQPATAMQEKHLYTSVDDGKHWTRVADSAVGSEGLRNLPSVGHLGALVAVSATRAFIGLNRSTVIATGDGGRTWQNAIDPEVFGGEATGWTLTFPDPQHGWAAANFGVLRTTDGGTSWQKVEIH